MRAVLDQNGGASCSSPVQHAAGTCSMLSYSARAGGVPGACKACNTGLGGMLSS